MQTIDMIQGASNRNQRLRLILLLIIAATFPFYCLGIFIIGSAPANMSQPTATATFVDATFTPLGADQFQSEPSASWTAPPPPNATMTPLRLLQPTPRQFVPPTAQPTDIIIVATVPPPAPTTFQPAFTIVPDITSGPADADEDGVADSDDDCPDEYGFAENYGCPFNDDPDRDGLRGEADLCPRDFAPDSPRGCSDRDDDGLDTSQDECPGQAGPIANRGCPVDDPG